MMDQEALPNYDVDLEEGEVSDSTDEVYTPLPRPASLGTTTPTNASSANKPSQMDDDDDNNEQRNDSDVDSNTDASSSSDESSDTCLKKLTPDEKGKARRHGKRIKRTVMVRIEPNSDNNDQMKARFKKYDIWTAALQEEALTETMRSCDVTQNGFSDRNVENYDFCLRYRLNGENSLKRRLSNSTDDLSEGENQPHLKRMKRSTRGTIYQEQRKSFRDRLGKRRDRHGRRRGGSSTTSGSDSNSYEPRCIENLDDVGGRDTVDVAREMATKLHEDKDELLARTIEVLGIELPLEIYKETQRIEAEGGMTIKVKLLYYNDS
uniref:Phosphorylated adapter RNA export protein n=1 Tax=Glossina brevipalpis TaxID=37001 RepID=A0A1A9W0Z6_9MUSC